MTLYPLRPGDRLFVCHGHGRRDGIRASGDIVTVSRIDGAHATLSDGADILFLNHRLLVFQRVGDMRVWMVAFPEETRQSIEEVRMEFSDVRRRDIAAEMISVMTSRYDEPEQIERPDGGISWTTYPRAFRRAMDAMIEVLRQEAVERYPEEAESLTRLYVAQIFSLLFAGL